LCFFADSVCGRGLVAVREDIGFEIIRPADLGLSGGYHGEEGKEEGEEVLRDNRHIRLSR
jgi:hypothetical protein